LILNLSADYSLLYLRKVKLIESPVLIIGCPRSGTSLLFNLLSEVSTLWSIGYESKAIIERHHHPAVKGWVSGQLVAEDLTVLSRAEMLAEFAREAAPGSFWRRVNRGRAWLRTVPLWTRLKQSGGTAGVSGAAGTALPQTGLDAVRRLVRWRNSLFPGHAARRIRLLEKTPENCLRLPFLEALFPDAKAIYLIRDGRANISSLMQGWRHPHLFSGYNVPEQVAIPGVDRDRWAFTLIPGWRELLESPLEEVCAWQWVRCNEAVLEHRAHGSLAYLTVRYEDLIAEPGRELARIAEFAGVDYDRELARFANRLPYINVVTAPGTEKWRGQNGEAIGRIMPLIEPLTGELGYTAL
jgi:hypothetical protein